MKAVIFDMDGVIVVTEPARYKIIQDLVKQKGLTLKSDLFSSFGKTTKAFLKESFDDDALIADITQQYERIYKDHLGNYVQPLPAVVNAIKKYKGPLQFAIASNSDFVIVQKILMNLHIMNAFSIIVSKDKVTRAKPDPEIYLKAAELLGYQPDECAALEDSVTGVTSATAAGVNCYVKLNAYNSEDDFKGMNVKGYVTTEQEVMDFFGTITEKT